MQTIHRLKPTVFASLALFSAACSSEPASASPTSPNGTTNGIVAGTLEVTASSGKVTLRNTTEQLVGYMVVDKDQMVVALYPPCSNNCPMLIQAESVSIYYAQIPGHSPQSTAAVVMWWRYIVRADGTKAPNGYMQTTNVQLK